MVFSLFRRARIRKTLNYETPPNAVIARSEATRQSHVSRERLLRFARNDKGETDFVIQKKKGFTLIELLIVISIIGILATLIISAVQTAKAQARDVRRLSDLRNIETGLQLYFDKQREYPDVLNDMVPDIFPVVPTDPLGGGGANVYTYVPLVSASGAACGMGVQCLYYHIGINMENVGGAALRVDADACPAAGAGCVDVLPGTTISGADTAGCAGEAGRYFEDRVPNLRTRSVILNRLGR